jgi:hypothetical protein
MNETLNNKFTLKMLFTVVGFQEPTVVIMKTAISWAVMPCILLEVD